MKKWFEKNCNTNSGVVISSRVRLARNLKRYNFPIRIEEDEAKAMILEIKEALLGANGSMDQLFDVVDMTGLTQLDKMAMMEQHSISPQFVQRQCPTALMISKDEGMSIMVNEEDHLRIQAMTCGMDLHHVMKLASEIDDLLEEKLTFAFHQQFGYLTSCPTNVGTGLRASYMMHLPALETTGQLQFILDAIGKFGLTVRGIYGEGSEAQGSVFQISNQVTLGLTEQEIVDNLTAVTNQIIEQELIVRKKLLAEKYTQFEDAVYRSYGILSHARVLSSKEAMTLLSDIKLGIELGILKAELEHPLNIFDLMTNIQPANLQVHLNKSLNIEERNIARATYIRTHIPRLIEGGNDDE